MSTEVCEMARASCVDLFETYEVPLRASAPRRASGPQSCAVIGFVGDDVRGSVVLSAASPVLARTLGLDSAPRDWIGELANQLVGRLKNRLLNCGVDIALTTPIVLTGIDIEPLSFKGSTGLYSPFETDLGPVTMWVEVETGETFVLGEEQAPAGLIEGESMMFEF